MTPVEDAGFRRWTVRTPAVSELAPRACVLNCDRTPPSEEDTVRPPSAPGDAPAARRGPIPIPFFYATARQRSTRLERDSEYSANCSIR